MSISITLTIKQQQAKHFQDVREPFYLTPADITNKAPGDILRSEFLSIDIPGAQAWRILYLSEQLNGQKSVASGMIIAPTRTVPEEGRPVVAWAHPTLGMNLTCAPSRKANPFSGMPWLQAMRPTGKHLASAAVCRYTVGNYKGYG
jgi:hypothetical protein